ncbi:hypothetical protein PAXRUDRAFT_829595 [Paxillus rubicundulus Ve08.2h10]|uniref:Ribonuclease H2 subunit B n=1 Tax=Paxillus rubicundulus Ve08.2h10 TaxID=930991 RepID=A0A0D0DZX4_9AGAM|nr:hypothetical protein PAXRUDRAFT_829595 [Paxillus rubicundulus Ve08.2h10]
MDTHFSVLPLDVIDTVTFQLGSNPNYTTRSPRFLRLPHPRTGIASLFLAHEPETSESDGVRISKILEVQAVAPPNARSWFIGDEVVSDGKLLVMTPVDPLFLLIPILRAIKQHDGGTVNFRPAEDMFEDAARCVTETSRTGVAASPDMIGVEDVMKFAALECTKNAMKRVCDMKEITTEITVFRYSSEKVLQHLRKKVVTLSTPRITEMSRSLIRSLAKDGLMEDKHEDLLDLGRTKLACELLAQYLPQDIQEELLGSYDFTRLDAHLKVLQEEQSILPPDSSSIIKKSKATAAGLSADSKKRKKDGKSSQGVEKLKKANVSGMSKLSTFFTKKTT